MDLGGQNTLLAAQISWNRQKKRILDDLYNLLNESVIQPWQKSAILMRMDFVSRAHWYQMPARARFTHLMSVLGRGSGKSWGAAQHLAWRALMCRGVTMGVVAPDWSKGIEQRCFEDKGSGLVGNVIPSECIEQYNSKTGELFLKSGVKIEGFSSETPDKMRGANLAGCVWNDEIQSFAGGGQAIWDNEVFALRIARDADGKELQMQKLITCTPTPATTLLVDLYKRGRDRAQPEFLLVEGVPTYANAKNLHPEIVKEILRYEGTFRGDTEIHAKIILDDLQLFNESWFPVYTKRNMPARENMEFIVMSLDTAEKTGLKNDYSACTTWVVHRVTEPVQVPHPYMKGEFMEAYETKWVALLAGSWRARLSYPMLKEACLKEFDVWAKKMGVTRKDHNNQVRFLIEDQSSGVQLIQDFRAANMPVAVAKRHSQHKFDFISQQADIAKSKMLWLRGGFDPETGNRELTKQSSDVLDELTRFNKTIATSKQHTETMHDDFVDSVANVCQYFRAEGLASKKSDISYHRAESSAEADERETKRPEPSREAIY